MTKLVAHEGLWYEQQDMWSKYLRRPVETLGDLCFAQFAKMYRSSAQSKPSEEESMHPDPKGEDDASDDDHGYDTGGDDDSEDKFHFIMTHQTDSNKDCNEEDKSKKYYKKGDKLPEYIELNDPYPGEPKMMIKRKHPAVLRFNKINKDNNPQKYLLGELMLYRPTQEEIDVDQVEALYDETYNGKRKVDIVKAQVMEHLEGV